MARFDDFMTAGWTTSTEVFGTVNFTFPGVVGNVACDFNSLGYTQQVEVHGKIESITATIEVAISALATAPTHGALVTRVSDGKVFRVIGQTQTDGDTHQINLDTRNV
jgi:hypothetical protein